MSGSLSASLSGVATARKHESTSRTPAATAVAWACGADVRIREKYQGVEVDPVAALREAEAALDRGDLEAAGKHIEDYDGFRVCGGKEPPGGKEKHDLLWKRLSALRREPW